MASLDPSVSVLLCVHNGGSSGTNGASSFLRAALDSVLTQEIADGALELVAVNDGSTDDTAEILKEYADKDPRVRVLSRPWSGVGASLNAGLSLCRAPFVARMDGDDLCLPGRLQAQKAFLEARGDVDIVGGAVEVFREEEADGSNDVVATAAAASSPSSTAAAVSMAAASAPSSTPRPTSRLIHLPTDPALVSWSLPFFCPLAHPAVMFRREVVATQLGGYAAAWSPAEDLELWQRAARAGVRMANLPQVVLRLRKHARNESAATAASSASSAATAAISRSSPLQQLHALLASQQHVSLLLRAPVSLELLQCIREPAVHVRTVAQAQAAIQLLMALEAAAIDQLSHEASAATAAAAAAAAGSRPTAAAPSSNVQQSAAATARIRSDATARIGEIVILATQLESAPTSAVTDTPPQSSVVLLQQAASTAQTYRAPGAPQTFALAAMLGSSPVSSGAQQAAAPVQAASLMRAWLSRGPEAMMLFAKLARG